MKDFLKKTENNTRTFLAKQVAEYNRQNISLQVGQLRQKEILNKINDGIQKLRSPEEIKEALLLLHTLPNTNEKIARRMRAVSVRETLPFLLFSLSYVTEEEREVIASFLKTHFFSQGNEKERKEAVCTIISNENIHIAPETLNFLEREKALERYVKEENILENGKRDTQKTVTPIWVFRRTIARLPENEKIDLFEQYKKKIMDKSPDDFEDSLKKLAKIFDGADLGEHLAISLQWIREEYYEARSEKKKKKKEEIKEEQQISTDEIRQKELKSEEPDTEAMQEYFTKKVSDFSPNYEYFSQGLGQYSKELQNELALLLALHDVQPLSIDISSEDSVLRRLGVNQIIFTPSPTGFDVTLVCEEKKFQGISLSGTGEVIFPKKMSLSWAKNILEYEIARILYEHCKAHLEVTSDIDYRTTALGIMGFELKIEKEEPSNIEPEQEKQSSLSEELALNPEEQNYRDFLRSNYAVFLEVAQALERQGIELSNSTDLDGLLHYLGQQSSGQHIQKIVPSGGIEVVTNSKNPLAHIVASVAVYNPQDNRVFLNETWKLDKNMTREFQNSHLCMVNIKLDNEEKQLAAWISKEKRWVDIAGLQGIDPNEGMSEFRKDLVKELKQCVLYALLYSITRVDYSGTKGQPGHPAGGGQGPRENVKRTFPAEFPTPGRPLLIVEDGAMDGHLRDNIEGTRGSIAANFLYNPEDIFEDIVTHPAESNVEKLYTKGLYVRGSIFRAIFGGNELRDLTDAKADRVMVPLFEKDQITRIHDLMNISAKNIASTINRIGGQKQFKEKLMAQCQQQSVSCEENKILQVQSRLPQLNPDSVFIGGLGEAMTYRLPFGFSQNLDEIRGIPHIDDVESMDNGLVRLISGKGVKLRDNFGIVQNSRSNAMTVAAHMRNEAYNVREAPESPILDLHPAIQVVLVFENEKKQYALIHVLSSKSAMDPRNRGIDSIGMRGIMINPLFENVLNQCGKENTSGVFAGFDEPDPRKNRRFSQKDIQRMQNNGFWGIPVKKSFLLVFDGVEVGVRQFLKNPSYREFLGWAHKNQLTDGEWQGLSGYDPEVAKIQSEMYKILGTNYLGEP